MVMVSLCLLLSHLGFVLTLCGRKGSVRRCYYLLNAILHFMKL